MIKIDNIKIENLNAVYQELASTIGIESMIEIYSLYKGQQISFPIRMFSKEYTSQKILSEYNGSNVKEIAKKYNYSERWIREVIKRNKTLK